MPYRERAVAMLTWGKSLVQREPTPQSASAEIIAAVPPLDGLPEHKLEYIKALITLCTDDVRQVTLYISVSFVLTAVVVNGLLPEDLSRVATWLLFMFLFSIVMLAAGALCFFRYARKLHQTRMSLTRCIPSLDTRRARELWAGEAGVWHVHGRAYNLGLVLFGSGLLLQGLVLVGLLLGGPTS